MTPEKIISLIEMYETLLKKRGVRKIRMDENRAFGSLKYHERLSHAHFLCDGVKEFIKDSKISKANRHLASIQMLLSFAGVFTLEELMNHNRTP